MFLFKITVTITYLRTDPREIDLLHKHIDHTFQCFVKPLGYNIAWKESKSRVPSQSMGQLVTESDAFVVERKFLQYRNVLSSAKIFSGIIELLQSEGYVNITWKLAREKIVVE